MGLVVTSFSYAFAESISSDKQNYFLGETIVISGAVNYSEGKFIGLQILNPSKSDIVVIDQFFPKSDGTFSKSYNAKGAKWTENGNYSIKFVYDERVFEKSFFFEKLPQTIEIPVPKPQESNPTDSFSEDPTQQETFQDPKLSIEGFPDPNKSPQYYLERYYSESEYKFWFDSTFSESSIEEVVAYTPTIIEGFPDNEHPPWYYVNRYLDEENYRGWFDSQFPTRTIYEVLGYPEPLFEKIPGWIKNNAKWWSEGQISDKEFLNGIGFLVNEKIIFIPHILGSEGTQITDIPPWIKNTSKLWSEDKITESEFLEGVKFLIENKLITI